MKAKSEQQLETETETQAHLPSLVAMRRLIIINISSRTTS